MRKGYKNAFNCKKCPQSNDENGCPAWWEYPGEAGQIIKGCSFDQRIMLSILLHCMHESHCAAASADKATNYAVDAAEAARSSMRASATSSALILGAMTGQITPVRHIEGPDGNEAVLPITGPMD